MTAAFAVVAISLTCNPRLLSVTGSISIRESATVNSSISWLIRGLFAAVDDDAMSRRKVAAELATLSACPGSLANAERFRFPLQNRHQG